MLEVNIAEIDTIARIYQSRELSRDHARYCIITPFQHYGVGTLVRFGNKLLTCTKIERMTLYHAAQTYFKECGYASENEFMAAWRANIAPFIACLDVIAHVFTPVDPNELTSRIVHDETLATEPNMTIGERILEVHKIEAARELARQKFCDFMESLNDVALACGVTEGAKTVNSMDKFVKAMGYIVAEPEGGIFVPQFRVIWKRNCE